LKIEWFNDITKRVDIKYELKRIQNLIVSQITHSDAFKKFNADKLIDFQLDKNSHYTSKSIYMQINDGQCFISIDIKQANFSSLKYYDKNIVLGCDTWEELLSKYTTHQYFLKSKIIRQIILSKLNSKKTKYHYEVDILPNI